MHVTYLAPFRVPFSLDKEAVLDRRADWVKLLQGDELPDAPNAEWGNYGWGQESDLVLHGAAEQDGSALFNWRYYTLRFGEDVETEGLPGEDVPDEPWELMRAGSNARWEVRLVNNTVALLVLDVELSMDAFCDYVTGRPGTTRFGQYGERWARATLQAPVLRKALDSARSVLGGFVRDELTLLADTGSNMYAQDGRHPLWTHTCYVFDEGEKERLGGLRAPFLALFGRPGPAEEWLAGGSNAYGWGSTAILESAGEADPWVNGACTSQYYYACLDIADFELSVSVAKQFNASKEGQLHGVSSAIRDLTHTVRRIHSDYEFLRIRANGECATAIHAYHDRWLFDNLTKGVAAKVDWLGDLRKRVAEEINESNQAQLSKVLGFISAFSLTFLIINIHGYITDNYDPRDPRSLAGWLFNASYLAVLAVGVGLCFVLWRFTVIKSRKAK